MKVIVANNLSKTDLPFDALLYWGGLATEIPTGWQIYSSAADAFIMGTDPSGILLTKQGTAEHFHSEIGTALGGKHTHPSIAPQTSSDATANVYVTNGTDKKGNGTHNHQIGGTFDEGGEHSHAISNTSTSSHLPVYIRFYLMKNIGATDIPVRAIALWPGTGSTIPRGWQVCDGTNGTPNILNSFIYVPNSDIDQGKTGGASKHNHTRQTNTRTDSHHHMITLLGNPPSSEPIYAKSGSNIISTDPHYHSGQVFSLRSAYHSHTISKLNDANHLPPHIRLYYIMRVE